MESNANQRKTNMSGKLVEFEETLQVLASLVSRGVSNSRLRCWRAAFFLLCWCTGPASGFFLRAERYPVRQSDHSARREGTSVARCEFCPTAAV